MANPHGDEMVPEVDVSEISTFVEGLDHPEGLAFDNRGNLWAGGEAGQIYRICPSGRIDEITRLEAFCAGLAFSPDHELFVCHAGRGELVHVKPGGDHRVFADRAGSHKLVCPNYPVFTRDGSCYVTDSGDWRGHNGFLLRFSSDARGEMLAGPFGYVNGLALTPDEWTLYMVETDTNRILRLELTAAGTPEDPPVPLVDVGRAPDGLALDADGGLYVCCYASDDIHRLAPSGERSLVAHDPFGILLGGCTNLAFGGPGFDELFVANLSRYGITRVPVCHRGQPLANLWMGETV